MKCDPSADYFTCSDLACADTPPVSSRKFIKDINVHMKVCVDSTPDWCTTYGKKCGSFYTYVGVGCVNPATTYPGYQSTCG